VDFAVVKRGKLYFSREESVLSATKEMVNTFLGETACKEIKYALL
jgi:hypothetical protein